MDTAIKTESSGITEAKSHPVRKFLRHFLEMYLAMGIGMFAAAFAFAMIVSTWGMTWVVGRDRFPQLFLLAMTLGMTLPMAAWMRFRGHGWRTTNEMAAAMYVPGIIFIVLVSLQVIDVKPACSLYCALMTPLMLVPMLLRRREYSQDHRHHSPAHQHSASPDCH